MTQITKSVNYDNSRFSTLIKKGKTIFELIIDFILVREHRRLRE